MKKVFLFLTILSLMFACITGCDKTSDEAEAERVPVEVEPVTKGNVKQSLSYNGDIKAEFQVKVFSKIPDRIEQIFVEEGDFVKKGQPIAKILATTIEQRVRQAKAALVAAKAQEANLLVELERARRLYKENAMSKQQYDAIHTQYESAQAQGEQAQAALTSAKSQLDDATISAPISGIIGKRNYEAGDMANPSMPLVTIVQMDRVKIIFDATEKDLGKLAVGQEAKVMVRSYADQAFHGKVTKISPVLDPMTRMAEIEVLIDNADKKLKPGMYAQVEVTTGIIGDVIVVPRHATVENTTMEKVSGEDQVVKNYYVFVVDKNQALQKKLDVQYVNHHWIAVNDGVAPGDSLVVLGQNNLRDSMLVSVVNQKGEDQ